MWLGSGIAMAVVQASSYSSNLTPSLGTSTCHTRVLKKRPTSFFFFSFFFCLSRAAPLAYGGSQARGLVRAVATAYATATATPDLSGV